MSSSSESSSSFSSSIPDYNAQLDQVNALLESDPNNEQFLKLKSDLQKVISLTSDLLQYQLSSSSSAVDIEKNAQDDEENDSNEDEEGDKLNIGKTELINDVDSDLDDLDADESNLKQVASAPQLTGIIQVGEVVEVRGGDRPYAGVVVEILTASEYRVKYYEYQAEVTLPVTSLTRIAPGSLTREEVAVGFKGQCKFSQDQLYYDAVVQELTPHGARVYYPQYGNAEEVPLAYLRPLVQKKQKEEKVTLIKIPENLKALPTDTEEEKLRKKKKLKAIKSKNRLISQEIEVQQVQQNWQKFVNKVTEFYVFLYNCYSYQFDLVEVEVYYYYLLSVCLNTSIQFSLLTV